MRHPNVNGLRIGDQLPELEVSISTKTIIMGATASRDWQPLHHDPAWAVNQAGLPDIIMNNYTQAGWICRYITDWSGPEGRVGRLRFKMMKPICPGKRMRMNGRIVAMNQDEELCWVTLELTLHSQDVLSTTAGASVALPLHRPSAAWQCANDQWQPPPCSD